MKSLPGGGAGPRPRGARPRLHYIDWLRVFLTVNVLVMHSLVTYREYDSGMWAGQVQDGKQDDTLAYVFDFFATGGLAYRMMMFFVVAGFFSRQSYGSKGAKRFLIDRTLRLLVPTLVFSFVFPPILNYISDTSTNGLMYNRITGEDVQDAREDDYEEQIASTVTNTTVAAGAPMAPSYPPLNGATVGRRLLQANLTELYPNFVPTDGELPPVGPVAPSGIEDDDEAQGSSLEEEGDESASADDAPDDDGADNEQGGDQDDAEDDEDEGDDPSELPPSPSLRDEFIYYYTEPFTFNVAAGPQWFVYQLWWFTLAYVAVVELSKLACMQAVWQRITGCCGRAKGGSAEQSKPANELSSIDMLDFETVQVMAGTEPGTSSGSLAASSHGSKPDSLPEGEQSAAAALPGDCESTVVTFKSVADPAAEPSDFKTMQLVSTTTDKPAHVQATPEMFSVRSVVLWGGVLIFSLSVLQFCARLAMWTNPEMLPDSYAQVYVYAINFEPAYFPQYVAAFIGGILGHKYNGFARLPTKIGVWALIGCAVSYPVIWASFQVSNEMNADKFWGKYPMYAPYVLFILGHSFFEMCWGTVFGVGLLVAFRELVNIKPGRIGAIIVGASYAVYIIHPIFVTLWGRALEGAEFPTFWINAIYVMYLTVISSWLVGAALKMIPGCNRIL